MENIFSESFGRRTFDGDTIEATHDGFRYVATVHHDSDHGCPWVEYDGHGPVSDWTRRDKSPGELVLCEDRGSKRFYDFAEACKTALRDGWGCEPYTIEGETARQKATRAARHDFEVLRAWCNDEWSWCGIAVQVFGLDGEELCDEYDFALWGIEYNYPGSANEYLLEIANEKAREAFENIVLPLQQAQATVAALEGVS
jgi:hypothetical protein